MSGRRLLGGRRLADRWLEASIKSFPRRLALQLLELLQTLIRHRLVVASFLLQAISLGLLLLQTRPILQHLLDLLLLARLLLKWLTRSAELTSTLAVAAQIQPVHDARNFLLVDVAKRIDSSTHSA